MKLTRFGPFALVLAVLALIAAGCGGDDDNEAVSACKQGVENSGLEGDLKDAAIEQCEQLEDVNVDPGAIPDTGDLTDDVPDVTDTTEESGDDSGSDSGDTGAVPEGFSSEELLEQCRDNVEAAVPEGEQRDQALDICDNTYGD